MSVTIPLHILASLLAHLDQDRDHTALATYSVQQQAALAPIATQVSSSDTSFDFEPAGPIPDEARGMMSTRTVTALEALDLDTVPAEPGTGPWYCVTKGTWIGLHKQWFVQFLSVSHSIY